MKTSKNLFIVFICIIIISCNSIEKVPVVPESQQRGFDDIKPTIPITEPQDGSIIVKPQVTGQVSAKLNNNLEVFGAAEREVVRRQQVSKEADDDLNNAIKDINSGDLDAARLKLKKAVGKYSR
tara:strand:- start:55 stop:426 length:372 start_codon:yes stop_codon:yes gene_type:complete